jgi:hypothetical protein
MLAAATTPSAPSLPPMSELYTSRQMTARHQHLLSEHRVAWALRHRRINGLSTSGAVFDSPCGELLIHEPAFLAWFLGLSNRAKPRRLRVKPSAAVPA